MKRSTLEILVRLTQDEVAERTSELLRALADREELEVQRSAIAKEYKERIGAISERIGELAEIIRATQEPRDIAVEERPLYAQGIVELYRLDTGERVDSRPVTAEERQVPLPRVVAVAPAATPPTMHPDAFVEPVPPSPSARATGDAARVCWACDETATHHVGLSSAGSGEPRSWVLACAECMSGACDLVASHPLGDCARRACADEVASEPEPKKKPRAKRASGDPST